MTRSSLVLCCWTLLVLQVPLVVPLARRCLQTFPVLLRAHSTALNRSAAEAVLVHKDSAFKTSVVRGKTRPEATPKPHRTAPLREPRVPWPDKNWTVLITVSWGFRDMFENWLWHFERLQQQGKLRGLGTVLLMAEDAAVYEQYKHYNQVAGLVVSKSGSLNTQGAMIYNSEDYGKLVRSRADRILAALQGHHQVLYSDVDTVWQGDPRGHFLGVHDIWQAVDEPNEYLCTCFMAVRRTKMSIKLLEQWSEEMRSGQPNRNQIAYNKALGRVRGAAKGTSGIKVMELPRDQFPSGRDYWGVNHHGVPFPPIENLSTALIIHNNWIKGKENKIARFQKAGFWHALDGVK